MKFFQTLKLKHFYLFDIKTIFSEKLLTKVKKSDIIIFKGADWNIAFFFADLQRTAVAENAVISLIVSERP